MLRFDAQESIATTQADLIVNTVNTVGVMGAGVAKAVKDRYPDVMGPYTEACRTKKLYPGGVQALRMSDGRFIVNLASKAHFKDASKPEWAGFGLLNLSRLLALPEMAGVRSVCLPPPGAGLGGLSPEAVQRMIRTYMHPHAERGVDITVSAPEINIRERAVRYSGIGSRETPPEVLRMMTEIAEGLADQEWILRSGNAEGADSAFEAGAPTQLTESYLPWEKEGVPHGIVAITPEHTRLFRSTYRDPAGGPWRPTMKRSATLLMTRNGNQVFGPDFTEPTDVIICWTPYGDPIGGTRQAIFLANLIDIPVLNLGGPAFKGATADQIISQAQEAVAARRAAMGIPTPSADATPRPA